MDPNEITVAAVQLASQDDLADNLARAAKLVRKAAERGAKIALLPENFAFMGEESDRRRMAEPVARSEDNQDGPIVAALRQMARDNAIELIAGGMPEASADPDRPYNTSLHLGAEGVIRASYRKIHLFDVDVGDGQVYRESASTQAGNDAVVTHAGGVQVGMTVCYDLRFGALFATLADMGAQIITVPAAFTLHTGKDHWHVLLRARAIEAQVFIVAAGQQGRHPRNRLTYGKSCIIDPWGDVLAQAPDGEGICVATLDLGRIDAVRASLPSRRHRRPIGRPD